MKMSLLSFETRRLGFGFFWQKRPQADWQLQSDPFLVWIELSIDYQDSYKQSPGKFLGPPLKWRDALVFCHPACKNTLSEQDILSKGVPRPAPTNIQQIGHGSRQIGKAGSCPQAMITIDGLAAHRQWYPFAGVISVRCRGIVAVIGCDKQHVICQRRLNSTLQSRSTNRWDDCRPKFRLHRYLTLHKLDTIMD